jgi:hypothetical protein
MQLLPTLMTFLSVFPRMPFALAAYLKACAIHDETYGTVWESIDVPLHIYGSIAPG